MVPLECIHFWKGVAQREKIRATDARCQRRPFAGFGDDQEPVIIGSPIHIERCVRRILPIVQGEELGVAEGALYRDAAGPHALGDQRRRHVRALPRPLTAVEPHDDRGEEAHRRAVISTPRDGQRRRGAGVARQSQEAAPRPVRGDVESGQIGVRPLVAVARHVGVDQAGIPGCDVLVLEAEALSGRMRRIDDQHVRPPDQPLEDVPRARRLEIERESPLVAVVEMPGIVVGGARLRRNLVRDPPRIAARRLDLDHVGAEVGQDHRRARTRDEARQVDHLESREDVVTRHE